MTRKRFWGLRNALSAKLRIWGKENGFSAFLSDSKDMRPVSGKPLVNFNNKNIPFKSYDEVWNSDNMKNLRKNIGMEE